MASSPSLGFYSFGEGDAIEKSGTHLLPSPPNSIFSVNPQTHVLDHYWVCSSGSLLSFEQGEDQYSIWVDALDDDLNMKSATMAEMGSEYCRVTRDDGDANQSFPPSQGVGGGLHKRPYMGDDMQASKKHCAGAARKPKGKPVPSKDSQSIAAKNRRERISERLKTLQDLVPNGTKVDLVTMLERAISYVKFLQLQVKVLATDEFWPSVGGKAPHLSQVKEAIDAILSSHKDRNSASK